MLELQYGTITVGGLDTSFAGGLGFANWGWGLELFCR